MERIDQQPDSDELPGPKPKVRIRKLGLELNSAGGLVDLIVDDHQLAATEHGLGDGVERVCNQTLLVKRFVDLRELLLGQGKDYGDRLDLRYYHYSSRIGGTHEIALIDQADAKPPVERRHERTILKEGLGVVDRALVQLHLRFELGDDGKLRVVLLPGHRGGLDQIGVALEVDLRISELRFVECLFGDCLVELGLIRSRIDLRQNVTGLDILTFPEIDAYDGTVDLATNCDHVERPDSADAVQVFWYVADRRLLGKHGDRGVAPKPRCGALRGLLAAVDNQPS